MSVTVEVGLLSGKTVSLRADLNEQVNTLRRRAQTALGVGRSRLLDHSGRALAVCALVKDSQLQNGASLTLHLSQVQACATDSAFAAILGDGSVVTWGGADKSGDSSAVQDQLKNVQQISRSRPLALLLLPFLAMVLS